MNLPTLEELTELTNNDVGIKAIYDFMLQIENQKKVLKADKEHLEMMLEKNQKRLKLERKTK